MTIDELYRFVQLIANKEQRGFIKPSEFDLLAEQAQLDLIHDRVARYETKAESTKQASSSLVQNHSVLDDIRTVIKKVILTYDDSAGSGVYKYPVNEIDIIEKAPLGEYLHFLRIFQTGLLPSVDAVLDVDPVHLDAGDNNIKLVTHDQLANRVNSQVCPVDENNIVAVMVEKGFEIYENGALEEKGAYALSLVYIYRPVAPHWGFTMINDQPVHNPSSSNTKQLTLPTKTHRELAQRILSYIGMSLRDKDPVTYAEAKVKDQQTSKQ